MSLFNQEFGKNPATGAETTFTSRIRELELVYGLSMDVARAVSLEEIYDRALDAVLESLGADRASLLLFDEDGVIRFRAWRGLSAVYRQAVEGHSPWTRDEKKPAPITVADVTTDAALEPFRETILAEGIRALAFIPLMTNERLLGKFMAYSNQPHQYSESEMQLGQTVANHVAFAIDRRIQEERLLQLNETLEERVRDRTAELTVVNEELVQRNQDLQNFATIASHDLQEPLRKISSFADLLSSEYADSLDKTARFYLGRIDSSASRMSQLLVDLLRYSQVATEESVLRRTDLNEIAEEVVADLHFQIKEAGARVHIAELPMVEVDAMQFRHLVMNLVSNAIKYRREDVTVTVEIAGFIDIEGVSDDEERKVFKLVVRDNGIGLDEKYADRIFQPFQRLHQTDYSGSGMGLAICRRIAERHRGSIDVRSTPGRGAEFIVVLPVDSN